MPGVPPPLDEEGCDTPRGGGGGGGSGGYGRGGAHLQRRLLADDLRDGDLKTSLASNLDAELEAMAANRPQQRQKRAPTRKKR